MEIIPFFLIVLILIAHYETVQFARRNVESWAKEHGIEIESMELRFMDTFSTGITYFTVKVKLPSGERRTASIESGTMHLPMSRHLDITWIETPTFDYDRLGK